MLLADAPAGWQSSREGRPWPSRVLSVCTVVHPALSAPPRSIRQHGGAIAGTGEAKEEKRNERLCQGKGRHGLPKRNGLRDGIGKKRRRLGRRGGRHRYGAVRRQRRRRLVTADGLVAERIRHCALRARAGRGRAAYAWRRNAPPEGRPRSLSAG